MPITQTPVKEKVQPTQKNLSAYIHDNGDHNGYANGASTPSFITPKVHPNIDQLLESGTLDGAIVSLDDYWTKIYDQTERVYEWNNGVLEEKPVADLRKFRMYIWFLNLLLDYLYTNPIATAIGHDMAFEFNTASGTRVRAPDIGVVLNTNPVPLGERERSYNGIFDLCIESVSDSKPSHILRDTTHKRTEYAQGGVTEYFILDDSPANRNNETAFYVLGPNGVYQPLPIHNGIVRSTVLSGFGLRIEDLFRQPNAAQLLNDPVYQGFAAPHLWAERQQAMVTTNSLRSAIQALENDLQQERARVEQERTRAEEAERRIAQIIAKAQSMGLDLSDI